MGTGSFPGVKRPGRGADHPPSPSAKVGNEYLLPSRPLVASYRVTFTFLLILLLLLLLLQGAYKLSDYFAKPYFHK
jgi:hypothetical protein